MKKWFLRGGMIAAGMAFSLFCATAVLTHPVYADENPADTKCVDAGQDNPDNVKCAGVGDDTATTAASSKDESRASVGGLYFRAGNAVLVDEELDQDVWVAGSSVTVKNHVYGDVFAAGENVSIEGTVHGDVRVAGSNVTITGTVEGNVLAAGNNVKIAKDAVVKGHVNAYGAIVAMDGTVEKTFSVGAENVNISGKIIGESTMDASYVAFAESAVLEGKATVKGPNEPTYGKAELKDKVEYTYVDLSATQEERNPSEELMARLMNALYWFVAFSIVGIAVIALWGERSAGIIHVINERAGTTFGIGVLLLCATPVAILLLAVTIIGLPLSILLAVLYVIALALGDLAVGLWLGSKLLPGQSEEGKRGLMVQFIVGFALLSVVMATPFVGWVVGAIAMIMGIGALARALTGVTVTKHKKHEAK